MHGALLFKGWGRFVQGGYECAMHVRALLAHPHGLTLQPEPTICRCRRTETHASARPQSPDLFAPRASVVGRPADRTATRDHCKPAIDDASSGLHLEQIQRNEIIDINVSLQCTHEHAPPRYFQNISFFGVEIFHVVERTSLQKLP